MAASLLFDKSSAEDVELETGLDRLAKDKLLWVDLRRDEEREIAPAADHLGLAETSSIRRLADVRRAAITGNDDALHVRSFRDRVTGRGELGELDAPTFLADLLEWVLGAYVDAFERIEDELEETEIEAIRSSYSSRVPVIGRTRP
jgi:hypothetical protein